MDFSHHPIPLPKIKPSSKIRKVSNKDKYECSDGTKVSQQYIKRKLSESYAKGLKMARCEAYPHKQAEGHSHIVKQSHLKDIKRTELIWNPEMYCYESHQANSEWDNASLEIEDHANIVKKMTILFEFDKVGFWKRFDRLSNFKVIEAIKKNCKL